MSLKPRNPWLAALASLLLPGLGHIYGGSLTKGLVLALLPFLLYVSGGLSRVVLHPFGWDLLVAVSVLFYLYVAWMLLSRRAAAGPETIYCNHSIAGTGISCCGGDSPSAGCYWVGLVWICLVLRAICSRR